MAITETKIVQVENSPSVINQTNEEWGQFGWSVLNVQITHSQDTRTYTKGLDYYTGDKTVETTTINYATITYQRDKQMPHYKEIASLESEYVSVLEEIDTMKFADSDQWKGLIGGFSFKDILILAALFFFFLPGAIIYFIYKRNKLKEIENMAEVKMGQQERNRKLADLEARRAAIVTEAADLMA